MTNHICPVEGCEYGENSNKSLAAVRAHINAVNDDAHEWADLKGDVEQQADTDPESGRDTDSGEETTDDTDDRDDGQQQPAGPDVDAEYEAQVLGAVEGDGDDADDGDDGDSNEVEVDAVDDATGGNQMGTAATLVAASVALALVVLLTRDNDSDPTPAETTNGDSDESGGEEPGWSTLE